MWCIRNIRCVNLDAKQHIDSTEASENANANALHVETSFPHGWMLRDLTAHLKMSTGNIYTVQIYRLTL